MTTLFLICDKHCQPCNVDALVLLALLERMESQKANAAQRNEHRESSHELCLLASKIDPTCSMALNHVANHSFYSWNTLDESAIVTSTNQVQVSLSKGASAVAEAVQVGDILQIKRTHIFPVTSVEKEEDSSNPEDVMFTFTVSTDVPSEWIGKSAIVEAKDASKITDVKNLATVALRTTNVLKIRAESLYILGRSYHMLRDFNIAFQLYEEALKCNPKMPLAIYGIAQLYLGREEYGPSLDKFLEVCTRLTD
jgi:tetratricopeptide (TPR) repeat protein